MTAGVNAYNDKKYADAAAAFEKVVAAEPYNRDALSNLSNTYLAMKDGPKLAATAAKLVAIEPLSENALKLQGEGYKQSAKVDQAVKTAEQVLALPADVKPSEFSATGTGANADARPPPAARRRRRRARPIAAGGGPDRGRVPERHRGTVVATQDAQVPALAAGASQEVKVAGQGAGITAWRYKRK